MKSALLISSLRFCYIMNYILKMKEVVFVVGKRHFKRQCNKWTISIMKKMSTLYHIAFFFYFLAKQLERCDIITEKQFAYHVMSYFHNQSRIQLKQCNYISLPISTLLILIFFLKLTTTVTARIGKNLLRQPTLFMCKTLLQTYMYYTYCLDNLISEVLYRCMQKTVNIVNSLRANERCTRKTKTEK